MIVYSSSTHTGCRTWPCWMTSPGRSTQTPSQTSGVRCVRVHSYSPRSIVAQLLTHWLVNILFICCNQPFSTRSTCSGRSICNVLTNRTSRGKASCIQCWTTGRTSKQVPSIPQLTLQRYRSPTLCKMLLRELWSCHECHNRHHLKRISRINHQWASKGACTVCGSNSSRIPLVRKQIHH